MHYVPVEIKVQACSSSNILGHWSLSDPAGLGCVRGRLGRGRYSQQNNWDWGGVRRKGPPFCIGDWWKGLHFMSAVVRWGGGEDRHSPSAIGEWLAFCIGFGGKDWGRRGLLEELAYCFWEVGVREDWCSISRIGGRNNNLHWELGEKVYHYASGAVWRVCNLGKELGWVVGKILIHGGEY